MANRISVEVKRTCCEMFEKGMKPREIYEEYFVKQFEYPSSFKSFYRYLYNWVGREYPDDATLKSGTYEGFIANGATVQVSKDGQIVQAWIRQKLGDFDPDDFIKAIRDEVEPYDYKPHDIDNSFHMLEIPLFDMHWGLVFMDYYEPVLNEILFLINSHIWDQIVIPFGQDFFHNDSIVNGQTTKGTNIEKVDMMRAVKEGRQFMYAIIEAALHNSSEVKVIYSAGNHDRSISWMFMQVLLERYGDNVVDDSLDYRKVITYGKNSIMVTHGDSRQATPKNLAHIFPVTFPEEFANANIREVHAGHLHHESDTDIFGVMVRRLSSGAQTSDWENKEDYIGTHRRFMIFDWGFEKLKSIHYI